MASDIINSVINKNIDKDDLQTDCKGTLIDITVN